MAATLENYYEALRHALASSSNRTANCFNSHLCTNPATLLQVGLWSEKRGSVRLGGAVVFGGAALAWPHAAHEQQPGKRPTIGFMGNNPAFWRPYVAAFVERLGELGWVDGRTIAIEYRWAEGRPERVAEIAADFVRLNVDVIVTYGDAVPVIKKATTIIPVVFALANNPVGGGLVASLARPGGNCALSAGFQYRNRCRAQPLKVLISDVESRGEIDDVAKRPDPNALFHESAL
jgi:hypothetical protein